MTQVGTNQSTTYHSQPSLSTPNGQTGRSSSTSRPQQQQQQQSQYDTEQLANIRPRLCILRKWPHYDGYGVHLARNQHWLGLRIGDVEPNSPAESGGLLREDVVLAVNGHSVENDDFFVILSFIQHELEADRIRFLVIDPHSADLARRHNLNIDENYRTCVRMETPTLTVSPEKLLYDQWRTTNSLDPTIAQNTIHLGPTLSLNQNQSNTNTHRHQQRSSDDARDDVYTFLPYSDHAIENGKSFFDILFEQEEHPAGSHRTDQLQPSRYTTNDPSNRDFTGDNNDNEHKNRGTQIKDGIKNIAKSGFENLKSILPTKHHDDREKSDHSDSKRKSSSDSTHYTPNNDEAPSLVDKVKNRIKGLGTSSNPTGQEKQSQPYENIWQSSSSPSQLPQSEDTNNNLRPEPRMCSLILRPGIDPIGISLQPDKDFGHIIRQVEPNSQADHAGIERDDCIISLNDIQLLHAPYDEVLNTLKRSRNEPNLDFLVAKKSYLLKSNQNNTTGEVLPSSNITERNLPSTIPATETLDQLYDKYNKNEQKPSYDELNKSNRPRETVSTSTPPERYDRVSSQLDNDRYPSKVQQGQILHGVGPATADRSSWGVSSGKSSDEFQLPTSGDSSVRSTSRDRRPDAADGRGPNSSLEDSFKPLQVGITNPTPAGSSSPNPSTVNDGQRTSRPIPPSEQRDNSSKVLPSPDTANNRGDTTPSRPSSTIQQISNAVPILPGQSSSTNNDRDERSSQAVPSDQPDLRLATMPLSEFKNYGYELHNIQLMQPTETSPVGLKLTKQQDPLQYIITAVAKGTKADLAGLRVNDWLIKIEDKDIRLVEFAEVSQDIRQLLTNAGLINMVIARKKTPASSPTIKQAEKQETAVASPPPPLTTTTTSSPSRTESVNRQQGESIPTSLLTTDITRDTPNNNQVRFTPDQSQNSSTIRSQPSSAPARETNVNAPGGPLSVGITNPISDDNSARSPRSPSRSPNQSPTREFTVNQQQKVSLTEQPSDVIDPKDIRQIVLKEALGLDFNSFIPEGDSQIQTHFISNVQSSSMADKAGLRDGDRILTVNDIDVRNAVHEDVRRMMQSKKPLQLTVVNDPKYLELIENVKRNQSKAEGTEDKSNSFPPDYKTVEQQKSGVSSDATSRNRIAPKTDSGSDLNTGRSKTESPIPARDDLSKYLNVLFTDDKGPLNVKHCILKKDPTYNGYGLLLRYQNGLHLIDQVEEDSPAYNAGLREDDVILYVDKKNVEQMTHDDVKILIRKLSLSNTNIDLVLLRKNDMSRYKAYQEKNTLDWKPIFQDKLPSETQQTEQLDSNNVRSLNDPTSVPRQNSSGKQPAPTPPATSSSSSSSSGTRVCVLQPSAERTAGFALSGKAPPPYVICQIEKNSPAEKAGLLLNDTLLAINGKSVTDTTYEETVKLVKEALQQKSVELLVREMQSNTANQRNISMGSSDSNNAGNSGSVGSESIGRGTNAVEEYQNRGKSSSSAAGSSTTTKTINSGR